MSGTPSVARYQQFFGVTASGPTNWLMHPIFAVGSFMGNELFFIIYITLMLWELDVEVCRRSSERPPTPASNPGALAACAPPPPPPPSSLLNPSAAPAPPPPNQCCAGASSIFSGRR